MSIYKAQNQKSHDAPKKLRFADEIRPIIDDEGGKVIQRWRSPSGHVRLSHL